MIKGTRRGRPWAGPLGLAAGVVTLLALVPFVASAQQSTSSKPAIEQLNTEDVARYRQIFELQEQGSWRKADRIIRTLDDRLLIGRVLFQRYMHPTKYRSKYKGALRLDEGIRGPARRQADLPIGPAPTTKGVQVTAPALGCA